MTHAKKLLTSRQGKGWEREADRAKQRMSPSEELVLTWDLSHGIWHQFLLGNQTEGHEQVSQSLAQVCLNNHVSKHLKNGLPWWLSSQRGLLPTQETRVRCLIPEDATCLGATIEPELQSPRAKAAEPTRHNSRAHTPKSLCPSATAPMPACPSTATREQAPLAMTGGKPAWQWRSSTAKNKQAKRFFFKNPLKEIASLDTLQWPSTLASRVQGPLQ